MNRFVYLDNNATTKINKNVQEKILKFLDLNYGNPSSTYSHGKKVKYEIDMAREYCAKLVNCNSQNLIFTSGGSESNCTAINSAIKNNKNKTKIITTKIEHSSILEYCKLLEQEGYEVIYLNINNEGFVDLNQLEKEVDDNTCLVAIQHVNNEVGNIVLPSVAIDKIKELKTKFDFKFFIDAVQSLGKIKIDINELGADFISFSGHKIGSPKGIGMLYILKQNEFIPLISGHQEFNLRGGTENVIGIIAMGLACNDIQNHFDEKIDKIRRVNQYLETELLKIDGVKINFYGYNRVGNTTSFSINKIDNNKLVLLLDRHGICVATGSACNSGISEDSYVLKNLNIKFPKNTIRVSISSETTISQIDYFLEILKKI